MPDDPMVELFRVMPAEAGGTTRELEVFMALAARRVARNRMLEPQAARIAAATHWEAAPDGAIVYSVAADLPAHERLVMLDALAGDLQALRWPGVAVDSEDERLQGVVGHRLAALGLNVAVAVPQPAERADGTPPRPPELAPETLVELIGRDGVHYGFGIVEGYAGDAPRHVHLRAGTGLLEGEVTVPLDRVDVQAIDLAQTDDRTLRAMLDAAPSPEVADLIVGEVLERADTERTAEERTAEEPDTERTAEERTAEEPAATAGASPPEAALAANPAATPDAPEGAAPPARRTISGMLSKALTAMRLRRADPERPAAPPEPGTLVQLSGVDGADRGLAIVERYEGPDRAAVVLRGGVGALAGAAPVPLATVTLEPIDPMAVSAARLRALISRPSSPEVSDLLLDAAMRRDAPPPAREEDVLAEPPAAAPAPVAPAVAAATPAAPAPAAPPPRDPPLAAPRPAEAATPPAAPPLRADPAFAPRRGFDARDLDGPATPAPAAPPAANRLADPAAPASGAPGWTELVALYRGIGLAPVLDDAAQVMTVTDPATGGRFRDDRRGLEADDANPSSVAAMARAAQARGWKSIVVDGDPEFIAQVREQFKDTGIHVRVRGEEIAPSAGKPASNGRKTPPGKRAHDEWGASDRAAGHDAAGHDAAGHAPAAHAPAAHDPADQDTAAPPRGGDDADGPAKPVSRRERVPMDPDAAALVKDYVHFRNEAGMYNRLMQEAFQGYKQDPGKWTKGLKPEDRDKVAAAARNVHSFEEMSDKAAKSVFRMKIITQHEEYPVYQGFKKERDTRVLKIAENLDRHNAFLINARITTKEFEADLQSARGAAQREKEKQERKQGGRGGKGGNGDRRGRDDN